MATAGIEESVSMSGDSESALMSILMSEQIVPGSEPSYQLCKDIYLYHPLGAKMAEAPIQMAQSQPRKITIQNKNGPGAPDEVVQEFQRVWEELRCDANILNLKRLSRVYGLSSLALGCEGQKSNELLDMSKIWDLPIFFNVFDPLNMSGSVFNNQRPNTADFNQVTRVICSGETYHRSRYRVAMNEEPIYIAYTDSGFGYTGRSVYQRALFPLKSFIKTMIADDMIATKNGLLVAKFKTPGSVPNKLMDAVARIKRILLKAAHVWQVTQIGIDEDIATLNMQGVDTAGTFARDNILKNAATAGNMPAKLLQNETMVGGMAEGTEDAKIISKYIDGVRVDMKPDYDWCDNITQFRAWMNPNFYKLIQSRYPEQYKNKTHDAAFSEWRRSFGATWPSMLVEPESEAIKAEEVKLEGVIALLNSYLPHMDPESKTKLLQWGAECFGENANLFPYKIELDWEVLQEHLEDQEAQQQENEAAMAAGGDGGGKKFPKFDSVKRMETRQQVARMRNLSENLGRALLEHKT